MIKKVIESGVTLFIAYVVACIFNADGFARGGLPTLSEFLGSIIYLVLWIVYFRAVFKEKKYYQILSSTIIWILTFLASTISLYVMVVNVNIRLHLIFSILFITPINGLSYIITKDTILCGLISIISLIFLLFGIKFLATRILINKK